MAIYWNICVVLILALCSQVFAQKKKIGIPGGWRDVDENDEYTQKALHFATEEYNKGSKDGYITDISRIIRLRKQVVAGMKYSMEVEALVSPCSKNELTTEECQNQNSKKQRCSFVVVHVPWRNYRELENGHCSTISN